MLRASLLAALAASLLLAPSAGAVIQLDRGIAGARINNTKAEVRAALGKPRRVIKREGEFGPTTTYRYRGGLRIIFLGDRVTLASTTGLGDRTNRGVGVGSTEQRVRDRVPGVTCETLVDLRLCSRGAEQPGERGTFFFIEDGRVTRVDVALVID
jgi:hypothetical protein